MSFSGEMKEEIARLIPEKEEEVRAELMAIIRFCGRILRQEESVAVFMETECRAGKDVCQINKKSI